MMQLAMCYTRMVPLLNRAIENVNKAVSEIKEFTEQKSGQSFKVRYIIDASMNVGGITGLMYVAFVIMCTTKACMCPRQFTLLHRRLALWWHLMRVMAANSSNDYVCVLCTR